MANFTPYSALAGGALVGLAAVLFMLFHGRIAGISGILGGLIPPATGDIAWRVTFIAGLVAGAALTGWAGGLVPQVPPRSLAVVAAAGLLVGLGTQLGGGCTSGHGVCGLARLSTRSLVATALFMLSGAIAVFLVRLGG
jgi:uncharacterized membrane protein YedE/YeeE